MFFTTLNILLKLCQTNNISKKDIIGLVQRTKKANLSVKRYKLAFFIEYIKVFIW